MVVSWDQALKRLFEESPQDFVSWMLPGTTYLSFVSTEFQSKLHGQRSADIMCHCLFANQPVILHLEFQSVGDKKMARRLLEYNINAGDKYGCPVISCVIYLRKDSYIVQPPLLSVQPDGELIYRFHFRATMLWELSAEDLLRTELPGIWALLPLSSDGKKIEVIEEMIRQLQEHGRHEVLSIGYVLALCVWTGESEQKWLRRRFEMLRDELRNTWVYKEIWQEGREEGLELGLQRGILQGLQQGLQQGRTEGLQEGEVVAFRKMLLTHVEKHFPSLQRLAQSVASATTEPAEMERLFLNVNLSHTFEEAQSALLESMKEGRN